MKVSFRPTEAEDAHLEAFDNTKLTALNTCPTWGVLRYQMHKTMPGSGRAMALEAGQAMHDVFAYVRLMTLCNQLNDHEKAEAAYKTHGPRLFNVDRWEIMAPAIDFDPRKLVRELEDTTKHGALIALETSGFYDDERDKRRTLSNLEECALTYINRWNWPDVWMRSDDPTDDVGIEIPYDFVVMIEDTMSQVADGPFRFTGKLDGIHIIDKRPTVQDNKTASRLSDAWETSFAINSQVTGYTLAASVFTQGQVRNAEILGLQIPIPKDVYSGYMRVPLTREDYHYRRWVSWLLHTVSLYRRWKDNPYEAPKYTHSCNRYFRPCSFIPFCDADDDEQKDIVENQMVIDEWSPLHEIGQE